MTPDELREVSRTFVEEVFNRRNLLHARNMLSPNFIERTASAPDLNADRAGVLEGLRLMLESSDLHVQILDHISDGRRVAIRGRCTGTDTGGLVPGVPATGKRFDFERMDGLTIGERGRFVEHFGVPDTRAVMEQLGLALPGPPAT